MFKYENDNQKIGLYLKKIIESKYPSQRQFCKAYLLKAGIDADNNEITKMCNRLCQIIKGKKALQLYDLPIFTALLEVTCEEIISCGKAVVPTTNHITNYNVAFSKDPQVWKDYINRPDKLILNNDEYNKTVIDYAIEFKNYDFIKFLMDEGYIWLVDNNISNNHPIGYGVISYGAGTNIKRRPINTQDCDLETYLNFDCEKLCLRQKIIALAIENKDFNQLDLLKAREVLSLQQLCDYGYNACINYDDYYNEDIIEAIIKSTDKVLDYFSDEFYVTNLKGDKYYFIYPFLNKIIEKLVKNNNKYALLIIRKAIIHNKKVYESLSKIIRDAIIYTKENYITYPEFPNEEIKNIVMNYNKLFEEKDFQGSAFISYWYHFNNKLIKFYSNIIYCDITSDDLLINSLIDELNQISNNIKDIDSIILTSLYK